METNRLDKSLESLFLFVKKESCLEDETIGLDTSLEDDLGMYGDDAVEFILNYAKHYGVDVSNFMAADYFSSEGRSALSVVFSSLFRDGKKRKPLTVRHLYNGIRYGRLDEETIGRTD